MSENGHWWCFAVSYMPSSWPFSRIRLWNATLHVLTTRATRRGMLDMLLSLHVDDDAHSHIRRKLWPGCVLGVYVHMCEWYEYVWWYLGQLGSGLFFKFRACHTSQCQKYWNWYCVDSKPAKSSVKVFLELCGPPGRSYLEEGKLECQRDSHIVW